MSSITAYEQLKSRLVNEPYTWLITGVAGFIGSNLLETLLKFNQRVVGLDNFATGFQRNLDEVKSLVTPAQWGTLPRARLVQNVIDTLTGLMAVINATNVAFDKVKVGRPHHHQQRQHHRLP